MEEGEDERKGERTSRVTEVDAVDVVVVAAATRRLVPKDNARDVLSTTLESPGKLSLNSH